MNPELGQAWFRVAVFVAFVSAVLIPFETPGSAEFVISVTSLVIGLAFIALIAVVVRRSNH